MNDKLQREGLYELHPKMEKCGFYNNHPFVISLLPGYGCRAVWIQTTMSTLKKICHIPDLEVFVISVEANIPPDDLGDWEQLVDEQPESKVWIRVIYNRDTDNSDLDTHLKYWGCIPDTHWGDTERTVKTLEYCENECKKLIDLLVDEKEE